MEACEIWELWFDVEEEYGTTRISRGGIRL